MPMSFTWPSFKFAGQDRQRVSHQVIQLYKSYSKAIQSGFQSMIHGYTDFIKHISPHSQPLFSQARKTTCKCTSCHYSIHSGDSSKCRYFSSARTFRALLPTAGRYNDPFGYYIYVCMYVYACSSSMFY